VLIQVGLSFMCLSCTVNGNMDISFVTCLTLPQHCQWSLLHSRRSLHSRVSLPRAPASLTIHCSGSDSLLHCQASTLRYIHNAKLLRYAHINSILPPTHVAQQQHSRTIECHINHTLTSLNVRVSTSSRGSVASRLPHSPSAHRPRNRTR